MALPMGGGGGGSGGGGGGGSSSGRGGRVVGDYIFGRQIGAGSFSVVWHARHRIHGTEVAVKEIAVGRLNKKLQESLMSEIVILKNISHPNIVSLHDIIEMKASGRIFLILEYCRGGDLSLYIQRHGRVPEVTAKHFMQQLASGLQVLRENNLIHRDLKPQNLLLSRNDDTAELKIADFGFARYLQPRGLAETLCGSPLYMAPEIMQLQKYDAKADLWSVGTILFQLVTGKTPFIGSNQIELLQNIIKSKDLRFPPGNSDLSSDCIDLCQKLLRRNPVERLTFEELFNHPFLTEDYSKKSLSWSTSSRAINDSMTNSNLARATDTNSLQDCLPFILDDVAEAQNVKPEGIPKNSPLRSTYGFSVGAGVDKKVTDKPSQKLDSFSRNTTKDKLECTSSKIWQKSAVGSPELSKLSIEQQPIKISSEGPSIVDSLEFVEQDYVLVSGPPLEVSSSSITVSRPCNSPCESDSQLRSSPKDGAVSVPMPIIGAACKTCGSAMMESPRCSPPSGTSQGSLDMADVIEVPSSDCTARIRSLQQCGSALTELVKEKVGSGRVLEAFSVQLVILAIWKQALHICHAQAASAVEGSPSQEIKVRGNKNEAFDSDESHNARRCQQPDASHIERAFLLEVGIAEELARELGPVDEAAEMPDAMEVIFQFALTLGRGGAADELINNMESAAALYSKAVQLLYFILVEAHSLILNPPFSLTASDRFRIRSYIDTLKNRQSQYRSQRMAFLGIEEQQSLL